LVKHSLLSLDFGLELSRALTALRCVAAVREKGDAWWFGENNKGVTGYFPGDYVEIQVGLLSLSNLLPPGLPARLSWLHP
jgi:hypothetical protein